LRFYKVNRVEHKVYDPEDTLPDGLIVQSDWRKGEVGDWVKADDDCIIQVLRRGKMQKPKGKHRTVGYIGTCTGTFPISRAKMDTSKRINIYSFGGGKLSDDVIGDRTKLNKNERMFVTYVSMGMDPESAYMKAYPTKNSRYARVKSGQLISTERVMTAMKEELKPVFEDLDISEKYVLEEIKGVIDSTEKDETRLKALFKLADIMDMEDKNKTTVTQVTGALFQGFSDDEIQAAERPKEISTGS
tara:strand:- start:3205 stop:3939 length:735 start_codon:yes stop_codon:yes gene_type:complete